MNGCRHPGHPRVAEEQRPQRPAVRRQRADRHQGVHGRGAVPGVGERGAVERPGGVRHDGRGEGERHPLPVGELQGGHHRQHDHGQGQNGGRGQPPAQRGEFGVRGGTFGEGRAGRAAGAAAGGRRGPGGWRGSGRRGGVAGGLDRRDEVADRDAARVLDPRLLGRVVDGGGDPVHPVELLLDTGGARRARHAADRQLDPLPRRSLVRVRGGRRHFRSPGRWVVPCGQARPTRS